MTPKNPRELLSGLTERQREVLELFCESLLYRDIGEELYIEESTVKTHMSKIKDRLQVADNTELAKVYCPLLSEGAPPPTPAAVPEEQEPEAQEAEPVEPEPELEPTMNNESLFVDKPAPRRRGSNWTLLLVGAVLGICLAVVVTVGIVYALRDRLWTEGAPGAAPASELETREVTHEVTVEVTSEGAAPAISPTPVVQTREAPVTEEEEVAATDTPTPEATPVPEEPTATPEPTDTATPAVTDTPVGMVSEMFQVEGDTADWGAHETGLYVQSGDQVEISYVQGEWWIGQDLNDDWVAQDPTGAEGYVGREGERVSSMLGVDDPDKCRILRSAPFGSLIGRIGEDGAWFLIGEETELEAQESGILYLSMNYLTNNRVPDCPYGNEGAIRVRVVVTPP